jgi:DNA-binding GntR family transcriptional regulator
MPTCDTGESLTALPLPPSRVQQVYDAIVDDICTGRITPGTPLRQELLAERFNVSRQPVQQALLLLKNQGILREFGRRGLEVIPLSADVAFHRLIVEESGNPLLVESTGVIWRNVQRTMSEVLYRGGAPSWIWEEHTAILDALEADDVPRAGDLARRHAEHGERLILDSMAAT